jgi:hypothetical protein
LEIEMQRVTLIGSAAGAIGASLARGLGAVLSVPAAVHRVATGTKRARQMVSAKTPHNRSKYMPHIGAKEQARAKRCYMQAFHGEMHLYSEHLRSKPVVQQMSKRQYAALNAQKQAA